MASKQGGCLYGRVSTRKQKDNLARQIRRLKEYASRHDLPIKTEITDIASGLKENRRGLMRVLNLAEKEVQGAVVYDRMPEQEALKLIWNILDDQAFSPIVGYNVLGLDLPVIFARSILLGVEATRAIDMRRYGNPDVIDLMVARFPSGRRKSLKTLAAQYGIEVPCPDVDGGDVFGMSPEERAEYVRRDVIVTRALYQRFRGYFC